MILTVYDDIGALSGIIGIIAGLIAIAGAVRKSLQAEPGGPRSPAAERRPGRYEAIAAVVAGAFAFVSVLGADPAAAGYPGALVVGLVVLYSALAVGAGFYARGLAVREHAPAPYERRWTLRLATGGIVAGLAAGSTLFLVSLLWGSPAPVELRVLAGSELVDPQFASILSDLRAATGVTLNLEPVGTLAGSDQIASGTRRDVDAAWFADDEYLKLFGTSPSAVAEPKDVMRSPVVIGLKRRVAARLRAKYGEQLTWRDIAVAASRGELRFAMTDPVKSNSGFAATLAVTSAFRDGPLHVDNAAVDFLEGFFRGQEVVADTSGFLVEAYRRNQRLLRQEDRVDGMVNYESVVLEQFSQPDAGSDGAAPQEPLEIIYPSDGVVGASYPLVLLSREARKRAAYKRALDWLLSADVQRRIADTTARRPSTPGVQLDARRFPQLPGAIELPEPPLLKALLNRSKDILSQPNRSIFVLDISDSMAFDDPRGGSRLDQLKVAIKGLTGAEAALQRDLAGELSLFRKREEVVLIPFGSHVRRPATFKLDSADPQGDAQRQIRAYVDGLHVAGGTATYDALLAAYREAAAAPERSDIVLLSDGKEHGGTASFGDFLADRPPGTRFIPVRAIQFGDASPDELQRLADRTRGEVYDATTESLIRVLRRIRLGR